MNIGATINVNKPGFDKYQISTDAVKFSGVLLFMVFIAILVWAGVALSRPSTLPIEQIKIKGDFTHLSLSDLQLLIADKVRGGFFNVDVNAVRLALLDEPWVSDVSVKRIWPATLRITVTEQTPAVRWGEQGLLNVTGEYFSPAKETIPLSLPLLNGPAGLELKVLEHFKLMREQLVKVGFDIAAVNLDERQSWSFTLTNGITVMLGRRAFTQRFNRFLTLAPAILSGRIESFKAVDMRYTNGFSIKRQ